MNPILLVVMMDLSYWNHEPFPEVLLCCVISGCHKIRLYLMNCSSQWDCRFASVCRPSVERRILGEWYGWKCRSVSVNVSVITDALYCHTQVCGLFCFPQIGCIAQYTFPAALHIKTLRRQRSLHCALICVLITSGFHDQCPVALGNLPSTESIPSNPYHPNTVLFIF